MNAHNSSLIANLISLDTSAINYCCNKNIEPAELNKKLEKS